MVATVYFSSCLSPLPTQHSSLTRSLCRSYHHYHPHFLAHITGARSTHSLTAASGLFKTKDEEALGDMMRHTPLLATTLNDLVSGKLSASAFPTVGGRDAGENDPLCRFNVIALALFAHARAHGRARAHTHTHTHTRARAYIT
jgi:hypothetical protein